MERINISVNLWLKMLKSNLAVKELILFRRHFVEMCVLQLQSGFKEKSQEICSSFFSPTTATHRQIQLRMKN
ncbi:MAG: hypothetical protein ACLQQ4_11205 [Bacteroidia bacterium]